MAEEDKTPIEELKDKALETASEAAGDLMDELVEDLTDGKDNSANPWYKRWWNNWTKSVSVLAIIGGLGTFGLQFSMEWYKERKDSEYERITAIEKQLQDLNKNIAVMNQAQKDMNEEQGQDRNSKQAMWRALRESNEINNEMRVQVRINAILNERNYNDIKNAHDREGSGPCQMDHSGPGKEKKPDVKNMSEFQKILKKTMGSDKEKEAIKKHEEEADNNEKINRLLDAVKKPKKDAKSLKDYIDDQHRQEQQQRKK